MLPIQRFHTISTSFIEVIYLRSGCASPLLNNIGSSIEWSLFTDTQLDSGFELFCWTELEQNRFSLIL